MSRQEDFEKSAMDYCEDHSHCIYFEAGAEWADQHPNWISVEEELPKENEEVLAYNAENEEVIVCDYHHKMFHCWPETFGKSITHWMPIVPPRKEANNE